MTGSKKIATFGLKERKSLIDRKDNEYSLRAQSRKHTQVYGTMPFIRDKLVEMMNLLDEQYTKTPFYGVLKMTEFLRSKEYVIGKDHVQTLLRRMGLEAVFAKPNLSNPHPEHKVYPYLLKDLTLERANQVWSADITYVRLLQGFAYLTAIIDWYSRYVLSWRLSNTLDSCFCIEALEEALEKYGNPRYLTVTREASLRARSSQAY